MKAAYSRTAPLLLGLSMIILLQSSMKAEAAAQPLPIAKPGCKDRCGDVRIPFPWGFGSGCSLDHWFEIDCRQVASPHSNSTKLPFLSKLDVEVMELQVEAMQLHEYVQSLQVIFRIPPVNACSTTVLADGTHPKHPTTTALDLRGSPYSFSSDDNVFVMEGCSGSAVLVDESHTSNTTAGVGCATICLNNTTVVETNNCHGVKCCQSPLLNDIQSYGVYFYGQAISDHKIGQNCLLAMLVGKDYLDEYIRNLSSSAPSGAAPVALNWLWRSNTRPDFNPHTSTCYFDQYTSCWICHCKENHNGSNPYVYGGCQVPQNCQSCPGSCVIDEDLYPKYTCRRTFLTSTTALIVYDVLGIAITPLLLVCGCGCAYRFIKRRRKAERRVKFFKLMLQAHQSSNNGNVESTKLFTHKELDKATEHFNENRVLGKGGQGTVYKGMLTDGRIVAVKKSLQMDEYQMEQFINEVVILSQINHRNVVKLLGCCLETEVPLLVYEYISNGTLYQHIHNPSEDVSLSWAIRLKIAADSAGAIAYLHSSSSTSIYHRDIKSANILLDDKYTAKVSDFGSSKTIEIDQTHLTTLVQGTMGYLDPEYFESSVFTEKSDVYSFAVVLLELLTSKKPIFRNERMEQKGLVSEFFFQMQNHGLSNILDPEVVKEAKEEEILAYVDLAKRCLNERGRLRPTMKEVATELEAIIKSPAETYTRDEQSLEDKGFDEIVMFEMSYNDFISSSSSTAAPSSMHIDLEPLLHESI